MALDLLFLATLVYGVYKGQSTGLVGGSMSVVKFLIGVVLALRLGPYASDFLNRGMGWESSYIGPIGSFLTVLIGSFFGLNAAGGALGKVLDSTGLSFVNKYAGSVVWVGALLFLFSGAINIGTRAGVFPPEVTNQSAVYPYVEPIMPIFKRTFGSTADRYYTEIKSGLGNLVGEAKKGAKEADQEYREEYYQRKGGGGGTVIREKSIADVRSSNNRKSRQSGYWIWDRGYREADNSNRSSYDEYSYHRTRDKVEKYKEPKVKKTKKTKKTKVKEPKVKNAKKSTRRSKVQTESSTQVTEYNNRSRVDYDPWWETYRRKYRDGQ